MLNGVTLNVDSKLLQSPSSAISSHNNVLSRFKGGEDDLEYSLVLADATESENVRLLARDKSDEQKLVPCAPFRGQINLTSVMSYLGANSAIDASNIQTDLLLAPAKDRAPKPAFDQSGNGAVDTMRHAYVPIPQARGLKRRWAMPGSGVGKSAPSSISSTPKKARLESKAAEAVVSEEEGGIEKEKRKKDKKEKKKKSKKSPKK